MIRKKLMKRTSLIGPVLAALLGAGIVLGCTSDTGIRHPNHVLTRDQLISLTFNDEFDGLDRAIDSRIARLRRQINWNGSQTIQTVYSAGYRFVAEE